jgi:hypothetical protein
MLNPRFDFLTLFKKLPTVNAHDKESNLSQYKKKKILKKTLMLLKYIYLTKRSMELIALNLTCTKKESRRILTE